jgi:hypothetical protein
MDRTEFPPNYDAIVEAIPAVAFARPLFAWGDDIYNPYRARIDKHLRRHEEEHARQQDGNPEKWWATYLADPKFRLEQEIEAYRVQFASYKRAEVSRERAHQYAWQIARQLSSPIYGGLIDHPSAYRAVTVP